MGALPGALLEIHVKTILLALIVVVPSTLQADSPKNDFKPVHVIWDQKVPMRDGETLSATIYRDPKQLKPLPVILTMTPYIAEHAAKQGTYFAQNGYVFVAMDLRGRGNSAGAFIPGQVEAKDGYDAVEWLAKQPWCDGKVATWGGSWLGFNQWSLAKEFPPHLKALAPTAAVHPGVDYPQPNGIPVSYMLRWLTFVHGRALNSGLFGATAFWNNAEWEQVSTRRPFKDLEAITGIQGTVFQTWLQHPREDAFWQAMTPRPEHYAKFRIPILTITGHYDGDQTGALTYYERHMAHGQPDVTQRHWLVIGPWDHSGTRRPKAELGGVTFGPGAVMSMEDLHKAWYDHVLKGGPRPEFLENRVACFIMGRNTWIHASSLSQIEGAPLNLELDLAGAQPGDVTRSGALTPHPPSGAGSVVLVADPGYLPPRADLDEENAQYLKDQRDAFKPNLGQVVWHSEPFKEETIIAGRPRLALRLACDQPDADLQATLQELLPDGSAIALSGGSLRLRYRRGGIEPILMTPGQTERVDFPVLDFFARALAKGSRLRLLVSAAPVFGYQRNTYTGGDLASEPLSAAKVAHITLLTGPGSGSLLQLPRPEAALLKAKEASAKSH